MKRLVSFIMTAILCVCMVPLLTGCSEPENDYAGWNGNWQISCLIENRDENDEPFFTNQQRKELDEKISQKAKELEMNILICIGRKYISDSNTKEFCDDTYDELFGNDTDGLMYYLDLSGKTPAYDYISTSGKAILLYEENKELIFNHMDNYLPASGQEIKQEQIYDAVGEFLSQLSVYAKSTTSGTSYYHDKNKGTYIYYKNGELYITHKKPLIIWVRIWVVSIMIGLLTALITFLVSKGKYTFKAKTNPSIYLSKDAVNFTQRNDHHIRTYQSRSRISSSSSGGGHRSGGGGHHSGGSHGGGGHHR